MTSSSLPQEAPEAERERFIGWRTHWRPNHRTVYGFAPHFVTDDWDPARGAGCALPLGIGFSSEAECDEWIRKNLDPA